MKNKELKILQIKKGETIKSAMKQLNVSTWKILFLVDEEDRLLGTLTDGDIRRWI
jgi:predicted transcriptional regulator